MTMEELFIRNAEEMITFGEGYAKSLKAGDILAIVGDLGAGKTHFTKGVAAGLGYADCTSPTFTLVNESHGGDYDLYHFDFYRIKKEEELWSLGWDEYLEKGGVVIAEWADLFPEVFPAHTTWMKIQHEKGGRVVKIMKP